MKSHFIKDINQQYSIREDGVIIKHYNNTRGIKSYKEKELCIHNGLSTIYMNKKKTTVSISLLLFDYFGFKYCNKCNKKFTRKRTDKTCSNCLINYSKSKEQIKKRNNKVTAKITKSYTASMLGLKVKEVTDELYQQHRKTLLTKRRIVKENKISINKTIMAIKIKDNREKLNKLNEYTQQQLLLAEENSSDIHTTTNSLRIYLKYDFPDGSSISFLIEGNV